jgi:hypothetical protein
MAAGTCTPVLVANEVSYDNFNARAVWACSIEFAGCTLQNSTTRL